MDNQKGFTLIELMVVVVIVAIFAAIAIPSYAQYMERKDLATAKQEALRIASELERFKAKNFSYKGFDASTLYSYTNTDTNGVVATDSYYNSTTGQLLLPVGSTVSTSKYILTLVDAGSAHKPLTVINGSDGKETSDSAGVNGLTWIIALERVKGSDGEPKQPRNYDLLLTSAGVRCMTKTKNIVTNYLNCGSNGESW
ncbi:type IV pilin protein [Acinetobacter piscicola]|uniref:type IV pilin protein n=1 Tax=Acinetobacter piscicola TaxID=2006115 RepID=UPI000B7D9223|nr:prepilin-type N-terminal cleavage/methylation domain-containing protein [Acinetobacter piscicola]